MDVTVSGLLDLSKTIAAELFSGVEYPWQALDLISDFIRKLGPTLPKSEYDEIAPEVWVAKDATVFPSAYIKGPCIIDHGTEVRQCAFIRGSALVGKNCVITSNVKSDKTLVVVKDGNEEIETKLKKMGAMLGDHVEVGCNSVLNPGSVIGRGASIYPLSCVRGVVLPGHIYKSAGSIVERI